MPDPWSPACSSLREKVLEHIFLAELSKVLLTREACDFEVLRAEADCGGYDLVIEANDVLRHIQLKAMRRGGKRADVGVSLALARKPSGCVIWMVVEETTFDLGHFYWFGGAPGEPLPPLGEKPVRHSKANSQGHKAERPAQRLVPRSRFRRIADIGELSLTLFGGWQASDQAALLESHLREHGARIPKVSESWLLRVQNGDFSAIPHDLDWAGSAEFAHLIDGYSLAERLGLGDPYKFEDLKWQAAVNEGAWTGTTIVLWTLVFLEHRRFRFEGRQPDENERALLDRLCRQLREQLQLAGAPAAEPAEAPAKA